MGVEDKKDKSQLKSKYEKQVELGVWISVIGHLIEAVSLSELQALEEETNLGEKQILSGVWMQAFGHLLEAIGVSKQLATLDQKSYFDAQKLAITGDVLVSIGAALDVLGGLEVLEEEQNDVNYLVP
ncbi:hypothetical protein HYI36_08815 [Bacillus sp. Gen3]|nr:hypothetical protein [Bacillus sp. Gen3]